LARSAPATVRLPLAPRDGATPPRSELAWSWRNPLPPPNPLRAVAFVGDVGWAIGRAGTVLTSADGGARWALQRTGGGGSQRRRGRLAGDRLGGWRRRADPARELTVRKKPGQAAQAHLA
jgi:hypothetical protein